MFRFSIRELMLVTVVVSVSVGWAIDHWRAYDSYLKAMIKNSAMEAKLRIEGYEVIQDGLRVEISSKVDPDKIFISGPAPNNQIIRAR